MAKQDVSFRPLGDLVLIKPLPVKEVVTASGFIVTSSTKITIKDGKVIAVGPGHYDDGALVPMTVKVGDTVKFVDDEFSKKEIWLNNEKHFIIPESNLLGIVK